MKKVSTLCAICALITVFAVAFGVIKKDALSVEESPNEAKAVEADKDILRLLQDARIIAFNSWSVDDGGGQRLSYIIQTFAQDPNYEGAGVKLTIFDDAGTAIYEDYFGEVHRVYPIYALRKLSAQLVMEVDYGGSASFLKVLDYQSGRVIDLMEALKPNNDFTVGAEVRPQFRSGLHPAQEPYQILLTHGVGLASPVEKSTEVLRYKEGAYRFTGSFPTRKVDDYIEKLIAKNSSTKARRSQR